jgi:hypothetical protein
MTSDSDEPEQECQENLKEGRTWVQVAKVRERLFHRIGLLAAAIGFVAGLVMLVADAVRWDVNLGNLPLVIYSVLGALIVLGFACFVIYGIVRALGWFISS